MVWHVVRRVLRGRAVRGHIRTIERKVRRVPGPLPVVYEAAEIADAFPGRIDQANVFDLKLLDEKILLAQEILLDRTADAVVVFFVFGNQPFDAAFDGFVSFQRIGNLVKPVPNGVRHILNGLCHPHLFADFGGPFLAAGVCEKTLIVQIAFRRREVLQGAVGTVMIGHDQPVR